MKVNENQTKILNAIRKNPNITQPEIQKVTGLFSGEITKEILDMKKLGILNHVGLANSGTWVIEQ